MANQYTSKNKYKIDGQTLIVYDCNNKEMLFDIDDMNILNLSRYAYRVDSNGYASNRVKGYAHRLIMNCPSNKQIDHINHNKTDNRKSNLRIVDNQQNSQHKKNTKGYYWAKHAKKWAATITHNGKSIHLGYYNNTNNARAAYLQAKKQYHPTAPIHG